MLPDQVTTEELADLLGLSAGHVRRLENDGILARVSRGRWPLRSSVMGYCANLRGRLARLGDGNLAQLQQQRHPEWSDTEDPDKMPVDQRLKYWQAVRQQQASIEHLNELAEGLNVEHRRRAADGVRIVREAIEAAGLTPRQLEGIRAAIAKGMESLA